MAQSFTIEAESREEFGKNAARRMRRSGRIPAVVYGGGAPAAPLLVNPNEILKILQSHSGQNALFSLEIKGKAPVRVMIRDWQSEPVKGTLLHVDMVRIARDEKLRVNVSIHVKGEPKGVKVQGGIFEFITREVEVECLPDDIPDEIILDVTELTLGKNLRVSDLPVGEKVKTLTDPHQVVAHVVALRAEEEKPAEIVEAAAPAEPEVIKKGKAETEEGEEEAETGKEKKEKEKEKEKKEKK
jgi:large subunit ribosomal protein L25